MFEEFVDKTFERQIEDLKALVAIPSVSRGEPEPGMPLGRHLHDVLQKAFEIGVSLGLPMGRSLDDYCGVLDYGEGEETLMIMAHLDVVPAGTGWTGDPFTAVVRDGRIIGRGVVDDKGAAVSAMYALAAVIDAGIPLTRKVRLFFGCDEEAGWKCIDRYKQTEPEPTLAFTPDANYPLVNSEMGICHAVYHKPLSGSGVRISCGTASNVVPGEASATLNFDPEPVKAPAGFVLTGNGDTLTATGRGGHAAHPDGARNALQALLSVLATQPLDADDLATASGLSALFAFDKHGEGFRLDVTDVSGHLTLVPTMLNWDENGATLTLDCRYPFSVSEEQLKEKLDAAFSAIGFEKETVECKPGHFIDPDGELVSTLMDVYETRTGRKSKPLSIGGGTYARGFAHAVAFGIEPENEQSECHMPDESTALTDVRFNTLVMADAIARLAR